MKTRTTTGLYGKHPMIYIHEEDATVDTKDDKPLIQFGLKKAEAILASLEEIKKFVEENKK